MFNVKSYWEDRYANGGNSGKGSYGDEAIYKANIINKIIKNLNVKSITDIGCGDGNNLQYYKGYTDYCGYDISQTAVNLCKQKYNLFFTTNKDEVKLDSDLCLCIDVLFHQVDDNLYKETLDMMFNNNFKYILLYTTNHDNNEGMSEHMKNRKVIDDIKAYNVVKYDHFKYKLIDIIGGDKYFILYG